MANSGSRNLMVIDTDCGVDDALAIMLALSYASEWDIIAITCCNGNTTVDNACVNVQRVLQLCGRTEIPIYRGCDKPLMGDHQLITVHADDGLGNAGHLYPVGDARICDGHACNALIELAKTYSQKINLVAIAPLTNLAIAHRLDPDFTANLKSLLVMGGNYQGVGNATAAAEYNFACDPEAANIIMTEARCPVLLAPLESIASCPIPWDMFEELVETETKKARFVKLISRDLAYCEQRIKNKSGFEDYDFVAMSVVLRPDVAISKITAPLRVETCGNYTRGQAVVDKRYVLRTDLTNAVNIITGLDNDTLNRMRKAFLKD